MSENTTTSTQNQINQLKEGQRGFNDKLDLILETLKKINDDQCKYVAEMDEKFIKHTDLIVAKIKKIMAEEMIKGKGIIEGVQPIEHVSYQVSYVSISTVSIPDLDSTSTNTMERRPEGRDYTIEEVEGEEDEDKELIREMAKIKEGITQNNPISLLLNSSINTNFINKKILQFYKPPVTKTLPWMVTVTNGENMCNNTNYQRDNWKTQGYQFTLDLRVIKMGVYHMVLKAN
jgi:hypothetical protein